MANPKLLERLKQGVKDWNTWRKKNRNMYVDLSKADLREADLRWANLSWANLSVNGQVGFHLLWLYELDLRERGIINLDNLVSETQPLSPASLTGEDHRGADLKGADLRVADLSWANLSWANLDDANLNLAYLSGANLSDAHLWDADLSGANLSGANLSGADLSGADLHDAIVADTVFARMDLREVKGLAEINHMGPSRVALHTIQLPQDGSALHFLRGTGVPDEWIDFWRGTMIHPIQYHSCFISYSSKDRTLARRLYADLQASGVRCWFASEDMKIGDKIRPRIDEAIQQQEKLLLLLSEHAIASCWVEDEVEAALEKEQRQHREVLFPVRLDESVMQTNTGWAAKLRRTHHIGDFTNWTDPQAYQQAFERLLRNLKKADERQDQEAKQ